jgi:hypothetical protein
MEAEMRKARKIGKHLMRNDSNYKDIGCPNPSEELNILNLSSHIT